MKAGTRIEMATGRARGRKKCRSNYQFLCKQGGGGEGNRSITQAGLRSTVPNLK